MRRQMLWIAVVALLLGTAVQAQDLAGDWQGTLQIGAQKLRLIVRFKPAAEGWTGGMYSLDQGTDWGASALISAVAVEHGRVKFDVPTVRGSYEGTVAPDHKSIAGMWTQRGSLPLVLRRPTPDTVWKDPAPHTIQFVTVAPAVKLEVLDFGGSGRPLVFLAGMGNTGHVFDKFAQKFTSTHHVYAITRRGFGDSSAPPDGYGADRLGDDVLAVLGALNINRPVLAGHSLGGEELSSIASRHPERVSGLIYLDAGYPYAFYNAERGDFGLDVLDVRRKLDQVANGPVDSRPAIKELLEEDLPRLERSLRARQKELDSMPPALLGAAQNQPGVARAIMLGGEKYTHLSGVPILAIYALPHDQGPLGGGDPAARAAREAQDEETTGAQAAAFEKGVPSARVVRIPHANHYLFRSNEADVLREMNAFLAGLK